MLALEEAGKLCAIDGLLFASADGQKAQMFVKAQRDHDTKLAALPLLPLLISNLSRVDPRYETHAYSETIAIAVYQMKMNGNAVLQITKDGNFSDLNTLKQQGLYVSLDGGKFVSPEDAVNANAAEAVSRFAWRVADTLNFVLKEGNLDRYMQQARSIRKKLSAEDHEASERLARQVSDILFGDTEDGPEES